MNSFAPIVFARDTGNAAPSPAVHGGKGASLIEMARAGFNVPPGIIIPTYACGAYHDLNPADRDDFVLARVQSLDEGLKWLSSKIGYMPLLSVRSGAPVSMPGMMSTILNVGLTHDNRQAWVDRLGEVTTNDCYRRLMEMLPVPTGEPPPGSLPGEGFQGQLILAVETVLGSWMSPNAIEYRRLNKIPDTYGTAVVIQAMVFGNAEGEGGSGVMFTRDPSTGENVKMGEFLSGAQGEDVVAGTHTPKSLKQISEETPDDAEPPRWLGELGEVGDRLEAVYRDMVDIEFTVQEGELFILQSRVGKRSARAAFKIAHDLFKGGVISEKEVFARLTPDQLKVARRQTIDPKFKTPPTFKGIGASPGIASGVPVYVSWIPDTIAEPAILVREETSPDDIAAMAKAAGILTARGGATCHAAVVARAMEKPCVVGVTALSDWGGIAAKVTIDGSTGHVWLDTDVPVVEPVDTPEFVEIGSMALDRFHAAEVVNDVRMRQWSSRWIRLMSNVFWRDMGLLNQCLDTLVSLPEHTRAHIILDCNEPLRAHGLDAPLWEFHMAKFDTPFRPEILAAIQARGDTLCGLTTVGLSATNHGHVTSGVRYAARFHENLVSEPTAILDWRFPCDTSYDAALKLCNRPGRATLLRRGMPRDYALFKVMKEVT